MRQVLMILIMLPVLFALPQEELQTEAAAIEQELSTQGREIGGTLTLDGSYDAQGALERLWERALEKIKERISAEISGAGLLVVLAVCSALGEALAGSGAGKAWIPISVSCAAALMLIGESKSLIVQADETLSRLQSYTDTALPLLFSACAASGAVLSSAGRYTAVCLASSVMTHVLRRIVLPLIHAFLALAVSGCIWENSLLRSVQNLIKWLAATAMTAGTSVFCAYIGVSGLISSSADAVAVKAAKTTVSTLLPVIGRILADSASLAVSAAEMIRSSIGVYSLIAVCAICLTPVITLAGKLMIYKMVSAAAVSFGDGRLGRLISGFADAAGMLLGLVGSFAFMMFFSIFAGMRTVNVL